MNNQDDCIQELMNTEQLNTFVVVEQFCDECMKLTPHHLDESKANASFSEASDNETFIAPISIRECVFCRENEENWLNGVE